MKNKFNKRILLGLLILVLGLLTIVPISTFAVGEDNKDNGSEKAKTDEDKETPKSECKKETIDKNYTFKVRTLSDKEGSVYGFKLEAYKNNKDVKTDLKFKLYQISDIKLNPPYEFTPGTEDKHYVLKLDKLNNISSYFKEYGSNETPDDGNPFYALFYLESIPGTNPSNCTTGIQFSIKTSVGDLGPQMETISYASETPIATVEKGHEINKDASRDSLSDFDKLIYDAYHAAINKNQSYTDGTTYYNKDSGNSSIWHIPEADKISLKCDFTQKYKPSEIKYGNYYKNVKYAYATNSFKIQGADYIYHPVNQKEGVNVPGGVCSVKCEEGVKVEYGPPIASKAGLCFEYKVRVTSHVNCYATAEPPVPVQSVYQVCTPTPDCVHDSGYVLDRAGPSEDFAACVNECDGGKYTLKCSKKCYKKVYGTSNNNISSYLYDDYVTEIANIDHTKDCTDPYGCYYQDPNGKILWAGRRASSKSHSFTNNFYDNEYGPSYFGRYYTNGNKIGASPNLKFIFTTASELVSGSPYYINNGDGFARKIYGTTAGNYCQAKCSWKGCGNPVKYNSEGKAVGINYYLNGGNNNDQMKADNEYNIKVYNDLVDQCSAAAKCSTQHAEFEISVDYNTGETKKTIAFPYDESSPEATVATKPDKLCSNNGQESDPCTNTWIKDSAENGKNPKSTIIYDKNAVKPANNTPKNAHEMHYYENPAGCYDPANKQSSAADDTMNRMYRGTLTFPGAWINYKTGEITFKPVTDPSHWEHIEDKFCIPRQAKDVNTKYWLYYQDGEVCGKTVNSINAGDIKDWNINGKIEDFGLYNWNIDISCFYALDEEDNTCDNPTDSSTAYRIRSIDLTDMFPDTDGYENGGSAQTGRDPGFNWTNNAAVTESKNSYYMSNPTTLINKIQGVGYGVYSNKYLDYQFYLDKDTLRSMRNEINDKNYTNFDEDGFSKSKEAGIGFYYSQKIRNLPGKNKYPDKTLVEKVCNNLKLDENGKYTDQCESTNGESEE